MAQDYNKTLNLPSTDFPMRASLPQREPDMLEKWEKERLYYQIIEKNEGKPRYVLHDGPPYANGDIHLGTALNKVLKDIIIRHKNISGYQSPYIPGWDTHGLPIELKARKKLGIEKTDISALDIRKHCEEFALQYVGEQMEDFKRLGVLGDWENPYLTLKKEFEARQIEIFGDMTEKGYIYKGLKPVYWCPECVTALAEAEIEYAQDPCDSIYVKFAVKSDKGLLSALGADLAKTYVVIWTTTTWTLPGNVAVCAGPDFEYSLVSANGEFYLVAKELLAKTMEAAKITDYTELGSFQGSELEHIVCAHPFLERDSLLIVGDHVTLETGTGFVHTAPGHGVEDFFVCQKYPGLHTIVPVDNHGKMTAEAGDFVAGMPTAKANKVIKQRLSETGHLFAQEHLEHQYPHCWRCKEPIIYRATEQWFCSIENFRDDVMRAIKEVQWVPSWGEERMIGMVRDRADWCISRQRIWGVPIPIFYCEECNTPHIDKDSINAVVELFRKEGSNAWYLYDAQEILGKTTVCKECGHTRFRKEMDIMDVWFDSGVSHASTLDGENGLGWPCDLYLEGSDQYRGWFQSSLLTSVAWRGRAPYRNVLSHGWVIDEEKRKMSKSLGNGISPKDIVKDFGADILRLWVASSDYQSDVKISNDLLKQLSETYRKIRNTARYILGNLYDFDPDTDLVADDALTEIDRWALAQMDKVCAKCQNAYEKFDFHIIFHTVHNFCTVDMSNFYLDILKDRLYAESANGALRRAAQTAMYKILRSLTLLLAPIIAYSAEEIWSYIPKSKAYDDASVMFNEMNKGGSFPADDAFMAKWEKIRAVRDDVNKALELARANKLIGKPLEAKVTLHCDAELLAFLQGVEELLATVFIVSQVALVSAGDADFTGEVAGLGVTVAKADGDKCERCWIYSDSVGKDAGHPTLCARCVEVVSSTN